MLQQDSAAPGEPVERRLTPEARERYSRQIALPGFGTGGQLELADARVLVIGAGGLGSAVVPALAATGVGTIGVVDADRVELSNLHRQTAHGVTDIGRLKVDSLADTVAAIDPGIRFHAHAETFDSHNAESLTREYDLLIDGSDNFATRYLACDAAVLAGVPLVWGAVLRYDGQVGVSWPEGPTYRDLFPMSPDAADVLDCSVGGVLPSVCAVIGGIVVAETVKLITGVGEPLIGRMLAYDARSGRVREVVFERSPDAPAVADVTGASSRRDAVSRASSASGTGTDQVPSVTARALLDELEGPTPPVLVDVRTPEEREQRPLTEATAGALVVPMGDLEQRSPRRAEHAARLAAIAAEGAGLVVVCSAGVRSRLAVLALAAEGVARARSLEGGTIALDAVRASASPARRGSSAGMVTT
jgi:adenylyltransferase/sulfurtransferase